MTEFPRYGTEPRIDDKNRCMGNWWGKRIYIVEGRTLFVQHVVGEQGHFEVTGYDLGGWIKIDSLQQVIGVYGGLSRERADEIVKTLTKLMRLEERRDVEYEDLQADRHAAYVASGAGAYVRPPEPVYEAGGTDVRLTPVPLKLLEAMSAGARLHEYAWRWTEWRLGSPSLPAVKIPERGINALRRVAFIQRDGVLPPGRLPRWFEFTWSITPAGHAWLEADAKPAASAAQQ